ncbi:hypothetical protein JCM5353_000653 [Sporobolomyces roseus]
MVLTRSDSSSSAWNLPSRESLDTLQSDQRRVRHIHSVLVRNLTLDPALDFLFVSTAPTSTSIQDDNNETFEPLSVGTSAGKGKGKAIDGRNRAGSSASWTSNLSNDSGEREGRELVLDSGGNSSRGGTLRTRPRRSSSAGTLLARAQKISEEGEEDDAEDYSEGTDGSPQLLPILSNSSSSSFPFPSSLPSDPTSTETLLRARSTSRASVNSNGTTASSSTIRQAPKLPPRPASPSSSSRTHSRPPTSSQFAARENKRRNEALKRRLLDSFISIEIIPSSSSASSIDDGDTTKALSRRRRGNTISGFNGASEGGGGGGGGGTSFFPRSSLHRSGSSTSIKSISSARKALRRRTVSSSIVPTTSTLPTSASAPRNLPPQQPFFISQPAVEQVNPCFYVDQSEFLVHKPSSDSTTLPLPDDENLSGWEGLREERIRIKVFGRPRRSDRKWNTDKGKGKGKGKEIEKEQAEDDEEDEKNWKVLTEWDIELSGLVSLGRNPAAFPSLPPNTILLALCPPSSPFAFTSSSTAPASSSSTLSTDLEYFTAPLHLLHRRQSTSLSRRRDFLRTSISDDEQNGCSCSESDSEQDSDIVGGGGGNNSDPGLDSTNQVSRRRARSGTMNNRWTGRSGNGRNSIWRERLKVEEEKRRRLEFIERSKRETRMVDLANFEVVERLWVGEREIEGIRREKEEVEKRLRREVGKGEVEELSRDREERRDRVGDLEGVDEAVREEVEDLTNDLERRRERLEKRKERLVKAREMDERNRTALKEVNEELDEKDRDISSLQTAILARRTHIVTLLSHLFPIEPVLPSPSHPSPPPLLFSIHSLALPNSTYPPSYSDDLLSSALGYAAHLTLFLAAYLGVPLCYPVIWRGSRSVVKDEISMMKGPRAFPLYGKGVDQYRFDYGVFLLNKNIEQLMYSQNLTVLDLRNTLPNLKTLVLSLSYGEWSEEYRQASLDPIFTDPDQVDDSHETVTHLEEEEGVIDLNEQGGSSQSSNGSNESNSSDPSTTPETSIESLPPRGEEEGSEVSASSSVPSTRSRSSSLASAASTIKVSDPTTTAATKLKRSSSRDSKSSNSRRGGGGGIEKLVPAHTSSTTTVSSNSPSSSGGSNNKITTVNGTDGGRGKLEKGKTSRVRTTSTSSSAGGGGYGSRFANSVWSAVAGKAGERESRGSSNVNGNGGGPEVEQ